MGKSLAEKILQAHTSEIIESPGQIVQCKVDIVLANDITAPLAIKSFLNMGADKVFDRDKVVLVCDHFTPNKDIDAAEQVKYVREFAKKMGITHYFEGGNSGIEHALLPELGLVGPNQVVVGADSHTCTYGALGAFATGLGSTDVAAAMALGELWFKVPPTIRVELKGQLPPYVGGKDIILYLIGKIGVDGAIYKALEFGGDLLKSLPIEARLTISNMAIEAGGKAGLFPVDDLTIQYCKQSGFGEVEIIEPDEDAEYDNVIEIDVSDLSPQVACPHLPENTKPVEEVEDIEVDQVVIGSCTNGRLSDLRVAAKIIEGHKVHSDVRLLVFPATPNIYSQALKEGIIKIFIDAGAVICPPTCGPCLGGHLGILASSEKCLATTNRNFRGRMGSLDSEVYLAGPEVAAATAIKGKITHPAKIK